MRKNSIQFWLGTLGILWIALDAGNLWAATEGGGKMGREFFWQVVSFVLLVILLSYALKNPLRKFLTKRREEIKNSLELAAKKEQGSEAQLVEWERKINSLNQEVAELHQKMKEEGVEERNRIVTRAQEEGERIRKQAQATADQEVKKARATLKKEMVDLSLEMAENLLKKTIQPQDQERLVKEYIGKMRGLR